MVKGIFGALRFLRSSVMFGFALLPLIKWFSLKKKVALWGKYAPVVFDINVAGKRFNVFQTIEVHDFIESFSNENLKQFIDESGLCLAHTYFSVLDQRQTGRMFKNSKGIFTSGIESVFGRINELSDQEKLWVTPVDEVIRYFNRLKDIEFDYDENGRIVPVSDTYEDDIFFRYFDQN